MGVIQVPKLITYKGDESIYYFDNRETCSVKLPNIETNAILNAEALDSHKQKHCDVVIVGKNSRDIDIYLVELRDINNPESNFVASVISPETVRDKALGSLELLQKEVLKLYPAVRLRTSGVRVTFVLMIGQPAMIVLGRANSLLTRIKSTFRFLARKGINEARIKTCGCDVYADQKLAYELL